MKQIIIIILLICGAAALTAQQVYEKDGPTYRLILGHGKGPLKVKYFNNGDTILSRDGAMIVTNARKLNRKLAYYEQGYRNPSMHHLKHIFYRFTRDVLSETILITAKT
jgi:hypothetical protein